MSKDNIILIGMPGSGKSTIGVLLAKAFCMDFIDTDLIIQKQAHKTLQSIIEEDGLTQFLAIENDVLTKLNCSNTIIASGGSAVLTQDGIEHLRQIGTTVYLEISCQTMVDRINNAQTRGLVLKTHENLNDLYEARIPLYEKYADLKINCDGLSAQNCLACVLASLSADNRRQKSGNSRK